MQTPPMNHEGNIIYRKYSTFTSHEYITIIGDKVMSSINPETGLCVRGIELKTVEEMDEIIRIILDGNCQPLDSTRHLRNPTNYEKAVKLLTKPKKKVASSDQAELIKILDELKEFTSKVCKKHKYATGTIGTCCQPSNCCIADKDEYLGYHCKLCKAKQLLLDLRNSQVLFEEE